MVKKVKTINNIGETLTIAMLLSLITLNQAIICSLMGSALIICVPAIIIDTKRINLTRGWKIKNYP